MITDPLMRDLLKEVRAKLKKDELYMTDLARAIGEEYKLVHAWVAQERQEPRGGIALRLRAWVDGDEKALKRAMKKIS